MHEHLVVFQLHFGVLCNFLDQNVLLRVGSWSTLLLRRHVFHHVIFLLSLQLLVSFVLVQDLDKLLLDDVM